MHDRVSTLGNGSGNTVLAGGGGAGMTLPIIPKRLEFRLSALVGDGVGRYGSGQFSDATIARDGSPQPLPEVLALTGLLFHANKKLDLYDYIGTEQILHRESYSVGKNNYGYGNPRYNNAGCDIELSAATTCTGNSRGIVQETVGFWWKFFHGDYGTMQAGAQYSYTDRTTFRGTGGSPHTDNNIAMFSFRYFPFQ